MADPTSYSRGYSFTNYEAANPADPKPGAQIDNELDNVETALGETQTALAEIRRSDGALVNGVVTADSLSVTLATELEPQLATAVTAAETAQTAAETAQTGAETAQTAAETAQGLSEDARGLAEKWASEAEDTEVVLGEYSAKHYSAKAEASAVTAQGYVSEIGGLSPSDGAFVVGDGANFVAETGAAARTSLGLMASASRPADLVAGETWAKDLGGGDFEVYLYDGTNDHLVHVEGQSIGQTTPALIVKTDALVVNGNNYPSAGALSHRNKIINGDFSVWQRATSQTSSGYGSDDRWVNEHSGSTKTHSREAFTVGQTDVPDNPEFCSRTDVTSVAGASNNVLKYQKIKDVRTFSGQDVTLSFWARADAAKNIAVEFAQNFGSGGSASVTAIGSQLVALTASWQKFKITVSIPSITGKTLGAGNFLSVYFWFDAGSGFNGRTASLGQQSGTFYISQVQVEKGSIATPFEVRDDEETRCLPYYQSSDGTAHGALGRASDGLGFASNSFLSRMRVAPTVVVTSGSGTPGTPVTTRSAFYCSVLNAGSSFTYSWTADAEL